MRRATVLLLSAASLLLATWLAAGVFAGATFEREIVAFAARPSSETGVRLTGIRHEAGFFESAGGFTAEIVGDCAGGALPRGVAVSVAYTASHLPLPGSMARIEWQARLADPAPAGRAEASIAALGHASIDHAGRFRSTFSLPELSLANGAARLALEPSTGSFSAGPGGFSLDWRLARLTARGPTGAAELDGVSVSVEAAETQGDAVLAVERLSTSYGLAEGLHLSIGASADDERLDTRLAFAMKTASALGRSARDLGVDARVTGLERRAASAAAKLLIARCGTASMTQEERQRFREAVRSLFARGFGIAVPGASVAVDEVGVQGNLRIEAGGSGSRDSPVALARTLRVGGALSIHAVKPYREQADLAIARGLLRENASGLETNFEYADGRLRLNGREQDAAAFRAALARADAALTALLSPLPQRARPR